MPKFQVLTGIINLGGDRDQQVFRGDDAPLTIPEVHILRVLHGGTDHVHSLVAVERDTILSGERTDAEERERLSHRYGSKIVSEVFPASIPLPTSDLAIQTEEEVEAARAAAEKAAQSVRDRKKAKAEDAPVPAAVVPSLTDLPNV